jgi:hypothetical protein
MLSNSAGVERVQSIGSFPEGCLVMLFSFVVPGKCGFFTGWCAICWTYTLINYILVFLTGITSVHTRWGQLAVVILILCTSVAEIFSFSFSGKTQ